MTYEQACEMFEAAWFQQIAESNTRLAVANSPSLALVPLTYCEVCEEPMTGLTRGRFHAVALCAGCLVSELYIVAETDYAAG